VEYENAGYIKLFDVPGILFDSNGNIVVMSAVDRFSVDSGEELTAHSVVRSNVNWSPGVSLRYACSLLNKFK
jgi:hypothetical protein